MTIPLELLAVLLIVIANGFFVAAEYALVTARRSRLEELAGEGMRRARIAVRIMDSPVRFIGTVQLGITAFSILLGVVGEPIVAGWIDGPLSHGVSFVIAYAFVTYLHVTLGELVPKAIALDRKEETALWVALPIEGVYIVSYPIVWFFQASANAMTRLVGIEPAPAGIIAHSEEEIRMIVAQAEETGEIEEGEREMLYKVFDFADKEVGDVMVPRPEVVALSIDLPPEECLAAAMEAPYTRYPVYRGSLDTVVGILHIRDLMREMNMRGGFGDVNVEALLRPAHVVPETKDLAALLHDFRRTKEHLAVVVDEYGATEGIVTLEDLLEEIVGEIEDEFDLPDESVERLADGRIRIDGTFSIDDFNEEFGVDLPVEDYHTMAGVVFGLLGRAPEPGDEVSYDGTHFKVVEIEGTRIERLEVTFTPVEPVDEAADEG
ncbi:MAG TPA: hemolysin family protein [Gaiellaceae bacterium]|nr:hemolysin family protein [Gaiellaceae bacterium]